jgi:carbonic anhydrase/acetyltransferase-like protein (isoleucine patch superfamily)
LKESFIIQATGFTQTIQAATIIPSRQIWPSGSELDSTYTTQAYKQYGLLVIFKPTSRWSKSTHLTPTIYFTNSKSLQTMALIKPVNGIAPRFGSDCYLAENATVVGDVVMGDQCSVWFNTVVRGDVNSIRIGNNVSVGHNAIVHGCTVHDNVLIGMGAIVMDHAVVHSNSIVAAGSVVLENTVIESNSIYAGIPAKKVKSIDPEQTQRLIEGIASNYIMYSDWFREEG